MRIEQLRRRLLLLRSARVLSAWAGAGVLLSNDALAQRDPTATEPSDRGATQDAHWQPVVPGKPPQFPRDHGAHPGFRTEWWYLTSVLRDPDDALWGVQITFFRSRTAHPSQNPSRFAPTQLLFAHAAIAPADARRLLHAERSARAGFDELARYSTEDLDVAIGDWSFVRQATDGTVSAHIRHPDFEIELQSTAPLVPVLQGNDGFSRKGPEPAQASWYYSVPQLPVRVRATLNSKALVRDLHGRAWLDHEWSSELLDARASGWDWVGLNFDDGRALMAFVVRSKEGGVLWRDARWIVDGRPMSPKPAVTFGPLRWWRSPRSGTDFPVQMRLIFDDGSALELRPLIDDQEVDASGSTGTIYWEGAMTVHNPEGRRVGAGYLELTGYAGRVLL